MTPNQKLSAAIAAVLSVHAATAPAAEGGAGAIADIVVTAQRRSENIQDVPITIQALTSEAISELNVTSFDDFVKFLPNVTQSTNGPGQSEIFMRGLSIGGGGNQGGGTTSPFPSVAVYLDEQSAALPGRNLDVFAADLERIEVLEGPQGTLFGGGAQTGVLRYITNKPKLNVTEGSVDASYGTTAHGDPNSSLTAVLNLPLVTDRLAIRGVLYNDRHGGYINNVASKFARSPTDLGLARYNGGVVPTNSLSINNNSLAANAINPLSYKGIRLSALYKINDDWDALLTQTYQDMYAQGVFYQMPNGSDGAGLTDTARPIGGQPLPPLSVTLFNPSYDKDRFTNTALVVNGKVGDLKLVYSGAYLTRHVDQVQDYTNYARGVFGYYYQCAGYSAYSAADGQCYTPSTIWREETKNTHQSHELRLSTPDDRRLRAIAGVYWEDYEIVDQTHWTYVTVPTCSPTGLNVNCYLPIQPWPGSPAYNPIPPTGFFNDIARGYKQLAEFASVDFDLIPKKLTITAGIRHFKYDAFQTGGNVGSFYCKQFTPTTYFGPCLTPYGTNMTIRPTNNSHATGNRARVNVSWHVTDRDLVYATWSQGFRAGAFNRSTACHLPDANGVNQFCIPPFTVPDNLTNVEVGWKTEWLDRHLQFNGSIYQENWTNVQVAFFDPQGGLGNLVFNVNGPSYRVRGIETQLVALTGHGLTLDGSASWNSSSQTNSPFLIANGPGSSTLGQPITSIPNPYGPLGSPTAFSPPFKFTARARYDWNINELNAFCQIIAQHQTHMVTATGYLNAYDLPGFTTYDASFGVAKGAWSAQIFGQNLTDVNTSLSTDSGQFILVKYPQRPRVVGLKIGYKFSGL